MSEKISVIMGVYNTKNKDLLKMAIESILNQTYKNLEFIICDDGSIDNTLLIIKDYQKKDNRIQILHNKINKGLATALNQCLLVANGTYIARQDDDDISNVNRLQKEINFLEKNSEYGFVGCAMDLIDEKGKWGESYLISKPKRKNFLFGVPFSHPTVLVRKVSYDAVQGYRVDNETIRTEDYDLFMRMYAKNIKGYNLHEKLYKYTQDRESYKKQKFKFRWNEVKIKYKGFKLLKLYPIGYIFLIKPIISGLLPSCLKNYIYKFRFRG